MSKAITEMTNGELSEEIRNLTLLKNSIARCIEEEPGFNDDAAQRVVVGTNDDLYHCYREHMKRGLANA